MSARKRRKTLTVAVVTMTIGGGPELDIMTVPPERLAPDLIDGLSLSPAASNDAAPRQQSNTPRLLQRH